MADVGVERTGRAAPTAAGAVGISGLTEPQAREFHRVFLVSFLIFLAIAIVAHFLVWSWRPWIPGVAGYEVSAPATTTVR